MKATIAKEFSFHAAHRLLKHDGPCRRLHGHTYRVVLEVTGRVTDDPESPQDGMVLDFDRLKDAWAPFHAAFDHHTLLEFTDPLVLLLGQAGEGGTVYTFDGPPTAENIATFILDNMDLAMAVRVYETPTSWAEVRR